LRGVREEIKLLFYTPVARFYNCEAQIHTGIARARVDAYAVAGEVLQAIGEDEPGNGKGSNAISASMCPP
jgi:hypothetical protein